MIQIKNLYAGYGEAPIIKNINMQIEPGKVLIIVGPNGSGKSTLLKAVMGFLKDVKGEIYYDGTLSQTLSGKEIAKKAAFLAQARNIPSITALRMVLHGRFPYMSYPRRYGKKDYEIAKKAMEMTGCRSYENKLVGELSGGERQSVYLAMALAQETKYIFMDEPTTYLDISRQLQLIHTAKCLAKEGKAVVLVLHDLSQALREADQVAVMHKGELCFIGTPEKVYESKILDRVFDVNVHKADTEHGDFYYCVPQKEGN